MAIDPTTRPSPKPPSHPLAGIALMIGAVACFSCLDSSAKWLSRSVDPLQIVAVRYIGSFLLVGLFLNPWTKPGLLRTGHLRLQGARALCLMAGTLSCFLALRFLPLTKVTSVTFSAPLLVALIAGPLLGERIGPRRIAAVFIGFAGVLVVTRPFGGGGLQPAILLAAAAACANALYYVLTRKLAAHDRSETTMVYTVLFGTAVALPLLPFVWHTPANLQTWLVMGAMALFGAVSHWLLILAHRLAPASLLAPFAYAQIISAATLGRVIFGETLDRWTLVGIAIVIGSGLYLLYREHVRHKYPSADLPA